MRKVNLGCGWDGPEGWINIDKSPKALFSRYSWSRYLLTKSLKFLVAIGLLGKNSITAMPVVPGFKMCDVSKGLPFKNNEVDWIYTSHLLEHLTPEKANLVINECRRVLVEGGIIRILVPDLRLLVDDYLKAKQTNNPESADRFMESLSLHAVGNPPPFFNRILERWTTGHQWMYDYESLAHKLREAGFKEVQKCEAGKSDMADIHLFSGEVTHPDSIYLEAKK